MRKATSRALTEQERTFYERLQVTERPHPTLPTPCMVAGPDERYNGVHGTSAHRMSWAINKNLGILPPSSVVIRIHCGVKNCVNPEHLLAGSHQDAIDDAVNRGIWHGRNTRSSEPDPSVGDDYADDELMPLRFYAKMIGRSYNRVWVRASSGEIPCHNIEGNLFIRKSTPWPDGRRKKQVIQ